MMRLMSNLVISNVKPAILDSYFTCGQNWETNNGHLLMGKLDS